MMWSHGCIFQLSYASAPCVDNHFLIESPLVSLKKDNFKKCPLIDGFNKDEGTFFIVTSEFGYNYYNKSEAPTVPKDIFDRELVHILTSFNVYNNDVIMDSIRQQYVDWSIADDPEADYLDPWNYYAGDSMFICPSVMEMRSHTLTSDGLHDIYQYFFTHVPSKSVLQEENFGPGWLGAGHVEELAFVFGYPFLTPELLEFHEYPDEEKSISQYVMKYWTNFAKTG